MDTVATADRYPPAPAALAADAPRAVLAAARGAAQAGIAATLAVVVDTEGSTYVGRGAVALFAGTAAPVGWLSGGCLEPEIARHAAACAASAELRWLELDTRDDEDLLGGSTPGCRGRLRLALLPLQALPGLADVLGQWLAGGCTLWLQLGSDGGVGAGIDGGEARRWSLPTAAEATGAGTLQWPPPPELLLLGAGPETAALLPTLHALGWRTTLVERRARWRGLAALADRHLDLTPDAAVAPSLRADAALVMHHHFELDREALAALAAADVRYVGLLGPVRRREDLFRVLPAAARAALAPRLRSPVGLHLGGTGAAAIALSIVAQLQAWRHGLEPPA